MYSCANIIITKKTYTEEIEAFYYEFFSQKELGFFFILKSFHVAPFIQTKQTKFTRTYLRLYERDTERLYENQQVILPVVLDKTRIVNAKK